MAFESHKRRAAIAATIAATLAASLFAAAPEPQLVELDEVIVRAKTALALESFVEFPRYDGIALSPSGTRIAMAWTENNYQRQLTVNEFPTLKRVDNQVLAPQMGGISDMRWVSERLLLVQPDYPRLGFPRVREPLGNLYIADTERHSLDVVNTDILMSFDPLGDQRREDEAAAAAKARSNARPADKAVTSKSPDRKARGPLRVVSARVGQAEHSLIQTTRSDRGGTSDGYGAFLLDLKDKGQSRVTTLPIGGGQFVTGPDRRIALAAGLNDQNERVVYFLPPEARETGADWQLVVRGAGGKRGLRPVAWTGTGEEYLALDGRDAATRGVVAWNAVTNTQRLLYRHPTADMDVFALDPTGKAWLFSGTDHFPVYWYPDPQHPLAQLHRALVKSLPSEQVEITSASDDMSAAVVRVQSGRRTPTYIVMNVKTGASLAGMQTYPKLRGTRLAPVEPIEFLARDGMVIRGYLTTPTDANDKPMKGLPLIVVAHDGPNGDASDFRYEFERQLFASRGYAVLQVNHRGSPGRGAVYERAGDGKWGREVQDDFVDGVKWAIRDGVAAADRVCFYGTRYGAYSAFMAAARQPEMFKCIIGVSGVYDLPDLLGDGKKEIPLPLQQVLGNSMDELKARSPVSYAKVIKAKALMMQQANDDLVPLGQFTGMRIALKDAGNAPQQETIGQQYNGIFTPENRAAVYTRMLRFIEQNIGK